PAAVVDVRLHGVDLDQLGAVRRLVKLVREDNGLGPGDRLRPRLKRRGFGGPLGATLRVRLRGEKRGEDDVPLGAVVRIPGVALLPARVVDLDVPLLRRLAGGQGHRTLYVAMLV